MSSQDKPKVSKTDKLSRIISLLTEDVPKDDSSFVGENEEKKISATSSSSSLQSRNLKGVRLSLMNSMMSNGQHYNTKLKIAGTFASDGTTSVLTKLDLDPNAISYTDWADFASIFDEFRIIGGECQFYPVYAFSTSDIGRVAVAFDNDSNGTPSNFDSVITYGTSKAFPLQTGGNTVHYKWRRPNVTRSAYWVDCAVPANSLGSIQVATVDTTTTNGRGVLYFTHFLDIEFRSRR